MIPDRDKLNWQRFKSAIKGPKGGRYVTYAGVELSEYFYIQSIQRSILPPREISLLTIPARHGAYFTGARYGVRKIDIELTVVADTPTAYMETLRFLAFCLDIEEPSELVISEEPDKHYFAILAGETDMVNDLMTVGKGTLSFICPDPFAYANDSKTITPVNRLFTFRNQGTTTTFPKFTVNFQHEATFASIISPDGVILIGNPNEPDQIVLPRTQNMINDAMTSTSSWAAHTALDEGRLNAGSVVVQDGSGIGASSYGTGTAGSKIWHGPAIRRDLSEPVKNFTVKSRIFFSSQDGNSSLDGDQTGRLEIYLFNQSGGKIGKLSMRDSYKYYEFNIPEIFIGNSTFLESEPKAPPGKKVKQKLYKIYTVKKGDTIDSIAKKHYMTPGELMRLNPQYREIKAGYRMKVFDKMGTKMVYPEHVGTWNDFYGELRITREGTRWHAQIARMDGSGKIIGKPLGRTYYDKEGKYTTADLSYVVIHFAQYENAPVVQKMRVTDLKVIKYNSDTTIDVPVLFEAGDELEVDLSDSSVWLNGDPFMQEVDVASNFFPVYEGTTEVRVNTDDPTATFTAEFTERFL